MIAPILGVVVAGPNEHSRMVSEGALRGAARRRGGAARWEGSSTAEEERITAKDGNSTAEERSNTAEDGRSTAEEGSCRAEEGKDGTGRRRGAALRAVE